MKSVPEKSIVKKVKIQSENTERHIPSSLDTQKHLHRKVINHSITQLKQQVKDLKNISINIQKAKSKQRHAPCH